MQKPREIGIQDSAKERGYSYTIIRRGQLFGGSYDNNYYWGTLFQLDKDEAMHDVVVGEGDELLGDTLRSTLAEVKAQACQGDCVRFPSFLQLCILTATYRFYDIYTS